MAVVIKKKRSLLECAIWIFILLSCVAYAVLLPFLLWAHCSQLKKHQSTGTFRIQAQEEGSGTNTAKYRPNAITRLEGFVRQYSSQQSAQGTYQPPKEEYSWWDGAVCEVNASDYLIGFFTLILTISTGGLWFVTRLTLVHAKEEANRQTHSNRTSMRIAVCAANATRRAADAAVTAQRPWLNFEFKNAGPIRFTEKGCEMHFAISFSVSGNSPATNIIEYISVIPSPDGNTLFTEVIQRVPCGPDVPIPDSLGHTQFPGQKRKPAIHLVEIPQDEIVAARDASLKGGKIAFCVTVSAHYRFSGGVGSTSRSYFVWARGIHPDKRRLLDPTNNTYVVSDIIISQIPDWDSAT